MALSSLRVLLLVGVGVAVLTPVASTNEKKTSPSSTTASVPTTIKTTTALPAKLVPFKERLRHLQARLEQLKSGDKQHPNLTENFHHHHHHHKGKSKLIGSKITEIPMGDQPITNKLTSNNNKKAIRSADAEEKEVKIGPFLVDGLSEQPEIIETKDSNGQSVFVIPGRSFSVHINGNDLLEEAKKAKDGNLVFNIDDGKNGNHIAKIDILKNNNNEGTSSSIVKREDLEPITLYALRGKNPLSPDQASPLRLDMNPYIPTYFAPYPYQNPIMPWR